jgi:hypothetical protein
MNNSEALAFAEKFLEQAAVFRDRFSSEATIALGPKSLRLFTDHSDKSGKLIREAFIPSISSSTVADIEVWNSSTGIKIPDQFWAREIKEQVFEVQGLQDSNYRIAFDRDQGFVYVFDKSNRRGAVWTREIHELHLGSFITPFRLLLSWVANSFDAEIVHASAVEVDGKGILINGPSGSGKSTLAIKAALSGGKILGDDVILISNNRLFAVYSRCKLIQNEISPDVSKLRKHEINDFDSTKQIIYLESFGDNFVLSCTFDAIVFPVIVDMNVHKKIKGSVALKIFAPNSLVEIFGGNSENYFRHLRFVKDHPCFRQGLSSNLDWDFDELKKIVNEISQP